MQQEVAVFRMMRPSPMFVTCKNRPEVKLEMAENMVVIVRITGRVRC